MGLVGALVFSPEPVIWPHSEPEQSIPCPLTSYSLKIHFNFTFPYMTRSFKMALSLRFLYQNSVWTSPPMYDTWPTSFFLIWSSGQYLVRSGEALLVKFSLFTCYLVPLIAKYFPRYSILEVLQVMFLPQCDTKFHANIK